MGTFETSRMATAIRNTLLSPCFPPPHVYTHTHPLTTTDYMMLLSSIHPPIVGPYSTRISPQTPRRDSESPRSDCYIRMYVCASRLCASMSTGHSISLTTTLYIITYIQPRSLRGVSETKRPPKNNTQTHTHHSIAYLPIQKNQTRTGYEGQIRVEFAKTDCELFFFFGVTTTGKISRIVSGNQQKV